MHIGHWQKCELQNAISTVYAANLFNVMVFFSFKYSLLIMLLQLPHIFLPFIPLLPCTTLPPASTP